MELLKDILSHTLKWVFTWSIALLPIIFQFYRQFVLEGTIQLGRLSETGEFFIVSIVMVAEPLAMLVTSKNRNAFSMVISFFIVIMLVTSGYFFCLNELRENSHAFMGDLYEKEVKSRLTFVSLTCIVWSIALGLATIVNIRLESRSKS